MLFCHNSAAFPPHKQNMSGSEREYENAETIRQVQRQKSLRVNPEALAKPSTPPTAIVSSPPSTSSQSMRRVPSGTAKPAVEGEKSRDRMCLYTHLFRTGTYENFQPLVIPQPVAVKYPSTKEERFADRTYEEIPDNFSKARLVFSINMLHLYYVQRMAYSIILHSQFWLMIQRQQTATRITIYSFRHPSSSSGFSQLEAALVDGQSWPRIIAHTSSSFLFILR